MKWNAQDLYTLLDMWIRRRGPVSGKLLSHKSNISRPGKAVDGDMPSPGSASWTEVCKQVS
jgi:hypothetical protein